MMKMRWAAMGLMLLGAYVVEAFGCSSSPAPVGGGGGECCSCAVSDTATGCSNAKTLKPLAAVADCTSFCAGQTSQLQMCPGATTPTISGTGVACPGNLAEGGAVTGAGGNTGAGGSSVVVGPDGAVISNGPAFGSMCKADADCGTGLTCLKVGDELFTGAGYPNGICTIDCTANMAACDPFQGLCLGVDPDPNAVNPKSFCFESCTPGTVARGDVKCHNRMDEACGVLSDNTTSACLPLCTTDMDCGARKCDIATGLCVDTITAGLPIGSPCMANTTTDACAGFCDPLPGQMPVQGGPAVPGRCAAFCVLGNTEGCGWRRTAVDAGATSTPVAGCLVAVFDPATAGDWGVCRQLCDSISDCSIQAKDWVCDQDPSLLMAFNHGACFYEPPDPDASTSTDSGGQ